MLTRPTLGDVVKHAQRTLAECTLFLCAGRAGFPKILQFFAGFLYKIRVTSTLNSRVILHYNSHRLAKELQRNYALRATTLVEFTQLFCARRAENFRKLCNFFARVRRKICVIPTLDACFFGSEFNADSANSRRRREACTAHAGRVHAFFCVRGVPDFQKFCNFFSGFLHKIRVTSTLDSRVILH